jgi:hypothetical protein
MRFQACGKIAYIPAAEAEREAERMREEDGYEEARVYECSARSKKGVAHFHVTSAGGYREAQRRERQG